MQKSAIIILSFHVCKAFGRALRGAPQAGANPAAAAPAAAATKEREVGRERGRVEDERKYLKENMLALSNAPQDQIIQTGQAT